MRLACVVGVAAALAPPPARPPLARRPPHRRGVALNAEGPPRRRWRFWRRRDAAADAPAPRAPLSREAQITLFALGYSADEVSAMTVEGARAVLDDPRVDAPFGGADAFEGVKEAVGAAVRFDDRLDPDSDDFYPEPTLTPRLILGSRDLTDADLWEMAKYQASGSEFVISGLDAGDVMPRDEVEARLQWLSWPDLERFTDLLKKESLFRLGLLGPSFADSIKAEARWRRTLYRRWIDFVDGEGLFPPNKQALRDDEFAFGLPQYATEETKEAYQALKAQHVQVLEAKQQSRAASPRGPRGVVEDFTPGIDSAFEGEKRRLAEWSRKAQARAKLADGVDSVSLACIGADPTADAQDRPKDQELVVRDGSS